ncbi:MAG: Hsp20/alpha crystallin family protein [Chitinivibrionales bacterium]
MARHMTLLDPVILLSATLKDFMVDRIVDISHPKHFKPRIDMVEEGEVYHLTSEMPGVKKEDLSIVIEKDILTISGKRPLKLHEKEHLHHNERMYGPFSRSLRLPGHVDPTQITAYFQNGILDIALKKTGRKEIQPYTVDIY